MTFILFFIAAIILPLSVARYYTLKRRRYNPDGTERKYYLKKEGARMYRLYAAKDFYGVEAGTKGGLIEFESNLSHSGDCWISEESKCIGTGRVEGDAVVSGSSLILDGTVVSGNAEVEDSTLSGIKVCGWANVKECAIHHRKHGLDVTVDGHVVLNGVEWDNMADVLLEGRFEVGKGVKFNAGALIQSQEDYHYNQAHGDTVYMTKSGEPAIILRRGEHKTLEEALKYLDEHYDHYPPHSFRCRFLEIAHEDLIQRHGPILS